MYNASQLALIVGILFVIVSVPATYKVTNKVSYGLLKLRLADAAGNPSRAGIVVHALVLSALVYVLLTKMI